MPDCYSPLPKRRDHQPALRGGSLSDLGAASAGAGAGARSGAPCIAGAGSGGGLVRKLTFSRTVERRRAVLSASAADSSCEAATVSGRIGSAGCGAGDDGAATGSGSTIQAQGAEKPSE